MAANVATTGATDGNRLGGHIPGQDDCWNKIGISGDQSCPELRTFVHCRNCPVFASAARTFFDRAAPEGYLAEWSRWLAASDNRDARGDAGGDLASGIRSRSEGISVLVFRLGPEWLAFRTHAVAEVTTPRPVHHVPHRSNEILSGLVNLEGQVQLCVSLHGLLGAATAPSAPRLVVLRDRDQAATWAFPADEVLGVQHVPRTQWRGVPSTLVNPAVGFSQAVLSWNGLSIGLLDEERGLLGIAEPWTVSEDLSGFSMIELFRMEAESHTATLSAGLVALEGTSASPEVVEPLMRAAHSLKGAARIVGLDPAVRVAHAMEDCFVAAQKGKIVLQSAHVDMLLKGVDLLVEIAQLGEPEVEAWQATHNAEIDGLVEHLNRLAQIRERELPGELTPFAASTAAITPPPLTPNETQVAAKADVPSQASDLIPTPVKPPPLPPLLTDDFSAWGENSS